MNWEQSLESDVSRWSGLLRRSGWAALVRPFLDLLPVLGLPLAQLLWMADPFVEQSELSQLANILEHPEGIHALREQLVEGARRE